MDNYIQYTVKLLFFCVAVIGLLSCNKKDRPLKLAITPAENIQEEGKYQEVTNASQFLIDAQEISQQIITLSRLAMQKGSPLHVKELGIILETEHIILVTEITILSKRRENKLSNPSKKFNLSDSNNLMNLTGTEFGKSYANRMVELHQEAIELFQEAAINGTDPEIMKYALASLPSLRNNLDHALVCQRECNESGKQFK